MGVTVRTAYDRPRAVAGVSRWALIDRDDTIGQHQERFAKVVDRLPQRVLIADDRVGDALMCARHPLEVLDEGLLAVGDVRCAGCTRCPRTARSPRAGGSR
jgi:hypothetical protein